MNRTYQIKKASFAIPRKKFRTLIDREVWLWAQGKSKMIGKITVPCSTDEFKSK